MTGSAHWNRARWLGWMALLATLAVPCAAESGWRVLRSPNFEAITDADATSAVARLQRLERLRSALTNHSLASPRTRTPTRVLFLRDERNFARLRPAVTNGPSRVDGLFTHTPYENQLAISLDEDERLAGQITHHEMMHLVCQDDARRWPLWFSEGVACCFETARPLDGRVELGLPPLNFLETLRNRMLFDWDALLSMDRRELYSLPFPNNEVVYPQSWILTHYLLFGLKPKDSAKLPDLLSLIEAGTNSIRAIERVFGWDAAALDARVRAHAANPRLPMRHFPHRAGESVPVSVERVSEADGEAWIVLWQVTVGRMRDAREQALRLGRQPGYFPQVAAGFMAFEEGDRRRAAEHFRAATRLRPDAALPHAYLARSLVETEFELGRIPLDPLLAAEARQALQRAVHINPGLQPAFATLGLVEHYGGGDPAEAEAALNRAIELDPRDFASRLTAGLVLERQGLTDQAASQLTTVVQNSRLLELVREARERLERLRSQPPQAAPGGLDRPVR